MINERHHSGLMQIGFQHSPSIESKSEFGSKVLDLCGWEGLSESVSNHFVGGAVDQLNLALVNDIADKMITNINVLGLGMVLVVLGECDGGLVVAQGCGRFRDVEEIGEDILQKRAEPQRFLRRMSHADVLTFSRRERDNLLAFAAPRDGTSI